MFLKIKNIPKVSWSSEKPYNFKPKFSTFFFLCFGLALFGLGEGLLIVSFTGASPWSVLAQGISLNINLSIGTITLLISVGVLILWIPLGQKPGMGTIFNALIIALMIDLCIKFVPTPSNYTYQLILAIISVLTVGIGGGIYLVSNLGVNHPHVDLHDIFEYKNRSFSFLTKSLSKLIIIILILSNLILYLQKNF